MLKIRLLLAVIAAMALSGVSFAQFGGPPIIPQPPQLPPQLPTDALKPAPATPAAPSISLPAAPVPAAPAQAAPARLCAANTRC